MSLSTRLASRLLELPPAVTSELECHVDLRVPMPDGVVLLANRIAPKGGDGLPVVLIRSPYAARGKKPDLTSRLLAERGYQVVMQNCRGTFGSGGVYRPLRDERDDGLATLRWLAEQPWFGGAVGMFGNSYYAYVQLAAGAGAPDHLRALVPMMGASRIYGIKRNDPFRFHVALGWVYQQYASHFAPSAPRRMWAMLRRGSAVRKGLNHLPVGEADRVALGRTIPYFQDILRNERPDDEFWAAMDHSRLVQDIDAPVHLVGSWYDFFLVDQLADYRSLRDAGKNPYLTICAGGHTAMAALKEGFKESLAWYDVHLRGNTAAQRSSPVRVCVMGIDTWVDLPSWPPPATPSDWYLRAGGGLTPEGPGSEVGDPSRYRYDPADPTPTVGGLVVFGGGAKDNRKLEARPDVLTFTSAPMTRATTVMGSATARLHVSSSAGHTDFYVRLCDVSPKGRSVNICEGIVRLTPRTPERDGVHHVTIDLLPTAHCFRPGHRIRLQVSSGAHPTYNRNLGTGEPITTATAMRVADQAVFHDGAHPSAITLPTVPALA